MPTYSYICDACGESFEKEQRISEDPIKKCPNCGKSKARRQIVSANFILKGGGWYSDGYGSSSSSSGSGGSKIGGAAPKSEKSESAPKSETKSEAKSEKKTEKKTESKPSAAE